METVLAALAASPAGPTAPDTSLGKKQLDNNLREQAATAKQLVTSHRELITSNIGAILTVSYRETRPWHRFALITLQKLNPASNSISLVYILQIALEPSTAISVDRRFVLDRTLEFFLKFNPYHIRYVGIAFQTLLEYILSGRAFTVRTVLC